MLQKLIIRNYAIIDYLAIEPDARLNIVTGETGAGKSIILGALSLILGERADTSVLINKDEKCVVEAHFDVAGNEQFATAMEEADLDSDKHCIIRREISTTGKSRAFVNDTPVNLNVLNGLTGLLVDLHQQFDHLDLENDHFQMDVVDAIGRNNSLRKTYSGLYKQYRSVSQELNALKQKQTQWQKESDYKKFLLEELLQVNFREDEVEQAEQQYKQLAHAERILSVLQSCRASMENGEQPLLNELKRNVQQLQGIADVMPDVIGLQERLSSAWAELKDITAELDGLETKVNLDQGLMQELQERMDAGYKLFKKHGVKTTNELITLQRQLEEELKESLDLDDAIAKLVKDLDALYNQLKTEAGKLSAARNKTAPVLADNINTLLALVGMPNARLRITVSEAAELKPLGIDTITFLLDANKSGQFLPIHKAASGGEMSRIMLSIKSLTAEAMQLPTLIFDEVDTGISGEAARQVGILLRQLAEHHQVICITHQPQVAAKGSRHFYVYKDEDSNKRITTKLRVLKDEERILSIARMIGGEQPSDAALQNARELVTH